MGLFSFFDRFRGPGGPNASGGDRSPYGEFWFEPVSARTGSGMRVSPDSALRLAAVYACVRILAETMASLPLVVYQRRPDGGKDKVTDHWLYRLMAKRPNRFQNPFEWREMLQGHMALRGNAYNQIITNPRGEIIELMPIHPDRVKIELLPSGEYRYRVTDRAGTVVIMPRGEVWHLRGLSSDGLMGMSPIELARENLGMALAAQDYGARFFANDAKPTGGWIEFPGSFKDSEAKKVFRESYQQAQTRRPGRMSDTVLVSAILLQSWVRHAWSCPPFSAEPASCQPCRPVAPTDGHRHRPAAPPWRYSSVPMIITQ